jgi:hypothetical protein
MCVHFALKATAVSFVGRDTIAGLPSGSFADTHLPTSISASLANGAFAAAGAVVPPPFLELEPHAAKATTATVPAAPAAPTASTVRRDTDRSSFINFLPRSRMTLTVNDTPVFGRRFIASV